MKTLTYCRVFLATLLCAAMLTAAMPVTSWSFIGAEAYKHIGPMAQDFALAFGLGEGNKTISAMDMGGVALAAIQGLNQKFSRRSEGKGR